MTVQVEIRADSMLGRESLVVYTHGLELPFRPSPQHPAVLLKLEEGAYLQVSWSHGSPDGDFVIVPMLAKAGARTGVRPGIWVDNAAEILG